MLAIYQQRAPTGILLLSSRMFSPMKSCGGARCTSATLQPQALPQ